MNSKNIVTNGIYCLLTNNDIEHSETKPTKTQVVDLGDLRETLTNNGLTFWMLNLNYLLTHLLIHLLSIVIIKIPIFTLMN